jgi:hypothetical protein
MKKPKKTKKQQKKRNPQDATLRNIAALKKRVTALEQHAEWLNERNRLTDRYIADFCARVAALEERAAPLLKYLQENQIGVWAPAKKEGNK